MKNVSLIAILASVFFLNSPPSVNAEPLHIRPKVDPGVILQHYYQTFILRTNQPWLYRPITEADVNLGQVESLIDIHYPTVSAPIIPPNDEQGPVIIISKRTQ